MADLSLTNNYFLFPGQDNFVRKWDEVMRERRLQRMRLTHIQEGMESAVFTGRQARGVFM